MTGRCGTMLGLLALAAGCGPKVASPQAPLEAPDPADRIRAIKALGEVGGGNPDPTVVVALVDRLDDEDRGVRFFAIARLDRLTGRRFGYRAHDPVGVRRVAVDRWRRYLERVGAGAPADRSGTSE